MNHRNALILLGAACIGIAVGVAFFSQETVSYTHLTLPTKA